MEEPEVWQWHNLHGVKKDVLNKTIDHNIDHLSAMMIVQTLST